jgi:hypothetical protein
MFTGEAFPDKERIASINAYLGAVPGTGGRRGYRHHRPLRRQRRDPGCLHPRILLSASDFDLLASGSLARHLLEYGPQATGGNYADWEEAGDIANIGYPIGTVSSDGSFTVTKPEGTGGCVTVGTAPGLLLYKIGDPQAYILPDLIYHFSEVEISQLGPDNAFVRACNILRCHNLGDYGETSVEIIGAESQFGDFAAGPEPREVVAKHDKAAAITILLRELTGFGLATPPGLRDFSGALAKPSLVVRLFSYLTPQEEIVFRVDADGRTIEFSDSPGPALDPSSARPIRDCQQWRTKSFRCR